MGRDARGTAQDDEEEKVIKRTITLCFWTLNAHETTAFTLLRKGGQRRSTVSDSNTQGPVADVSRGSHNVWRC